MGYMSEVLSTVSQIPYYTVIIVITQIFKPNMQKIIKVIEIIKMYDTHAHKPYCMSHSGRCAYSIDEPGVAPVLYSLGGVLTR